MHRKLRQKEGERGRWEGEGNHYKPRFLAQPWTKWPPALENPNYIAELTLPIYLDFIQIEEMN